MDLYEGFYLVYPYLHRNGFILKALEACTIACGCESIQSFSGSDYIDMWVLEKATSTIRNIMVRGGLLIPLYPLGAAFLTIPAPA